MSKHSIGLRLGLRPGRNRDVRGTTSVSPTRTSTYRKAEASTPVFAVTDCADMPDWLWSFDSTLPDSQSNGQFAPPLQAVRNAAGEHATLRQMRQQLRSRFRGVVSEEHTRPEGFVLLAVPPFGQLPKVVARLVRGASVDR